MRTESGFGHLGHKNAAEAELTPAALEESENLANLPTFTLIDKFFMAVGVIILLAGVVHYVAR